MGSKACLLIGFILMGLAVVTGAFGAHALQDTLSLKSLNAWKTAQYYQVIHAFGLIIVGMLSRTDQNRWLGRAGWCFLVGIVLFSGSVYLLALKSTWAWLGPITPIGGVFFIAGWMGLVLGYSKNAR